MGRRKNKNLKSIPKKKNFPRMSARRTKNRSQRSSLNNSPTRSIRFKSNLFRMKKITHYFRTKPRNFSRSRSRSKSGGMSARRTKNRNQGSNLNNSPTRSRSRPRNFSQSRSKSKSGAMSAY